MTEKKTDGLKFSYEDNPSLAETFADSVGQWYFDGNTLRIEFLVSRLDPQKTGDKSAGKKVPACRLVITPNAAIDLINRFRNLAGALEKAGFLKQKSGDKEASKGN